MYCSLIYILFISVLINSGSRYEVAYPSGISHFLEKIAFGVSLILYVSSAIYILLVNNFLVLVNRCLIGKYATETATQRHKNNQMTWLQHSIPKYIVQRYLNRIKEILQLMKWSGSISKAKPMKGHIIALKNTVNSLILVR